MPHFGLMDEYALGPVEGPLMRARLHIRGGKRRLRQGKISAGIITLYDALCSAMEQYIAVPERKKRLKMKEDDNLKDDKILFAVLNNSGILDGSFDYEAFNELVEKASKQEMPDYKKVLDGVESVMTQLGVMPFDENELPPEDLSTF